MLWRDVIAAFFVYVFHKSEREKAPSAHATESKTRFEILKPKEPNPTKHTPGFLLHISKGDIKRDKRPGTKGTYT
jgi:hypothetical protein